MTVDQQAPALFNGRPPTEILIPVVADYHNERNITLGTQLATLWNLPLRLVHSQLPDADSGAKALASSVAALKNAHPDLVIDGVEIEADDVPGGIRAAASDRSLLLLASDNASQWSEHDSAGEATLRQATDMVLLCGAGFQPVAQPTAIVVPLDGSPRSELALEPAIEVARASRTKLWLVTAVSPATVEAVARGRNAGERLSESAYLRSVADRLAERKVGDRGDLIVGDHLVSNYRSDHGATSLAQQGDHLVEILEIENTSLLVHLISAHSRRRSPWDG